MPEASSSIEHDTDESGSAWSLSPQTPLAHIHPPASGGNERLNEPVRYTGIKRGQRSALATRTREKRRATPGSVNAAPEHRMAQVLGRAEKSVRRRPDQIGADLSQLRLEHTEYPAVANDRSRHSRA
jgi:hypothetical protein